jgi:hypothetical protein
MEEIDSIPDYKKSSQQKMITRMTKELLDWKPKRF